MYITGKKNWGDAMDKLFPIGHKVDNIINEGVINRNCLTLEHAGGKALSLDDPKTIFAYEPDSNSDSIKLWIHGLGFLWPLLQRIEAGRQTNVELTLDNIISAYLDFMGDDAAPRIVGSADHALASSTLILIKAEMLLGNQWEQYDRVRQFLLLRSNLLASSDYYQPGNHGIMMDNALITLSVFINDGFSEKYIGLAAKRFVDQFSVAYDEDFFCNENTIQYSMWNNIMYRDTAYLLHHYGVYSEEIDYVADSIPKCYESLRKAVCQDGLIPPIGDVNEFRVDWFTPISGQHIFKNSGFLFDKYQDDENSNIYFAYNCGFTSWIHKHVDDQSVILRVDEDWVFCDSNMVTYDVANPKSKIVCSQDGHSGVFPILDAPIGTVIYEQILESCGIDDYSMLDRGFSIKGHNHFRDNLGKIERAIERDGNSLSITDNFKDAKQGVRARYVLYPNASCTMEYRGNTCRLNITSGKAWAKLTVNNVAEPVTEGHAVSTGQCSVRISDSYLATAYNVATPNKAIDIICDADHGSIECSIVFGSNK